MAYYRICPDCGARLDPGERCDCKSEREEAEKANRQREQEVQRMIRYEKNGQMRLAL